MKIPSFKEMVFVKKNMTGSQLLKLNPEATGTKGEPVVKKMHYIVKVPTTIKVNHFDRMVDAYKKGGEQAVTDYIKNLVQLNKEHKKTLLQEGEK